MAVIGSILLTIGIAVIVFAFRIYKTIYVKSEFLACLLSGLLLLIGFWIAIVGVAVIEAFKFSQTQ